MEWLIARNMISTQAKYDILTHNANKSETKNIWTQTDPWCIPIPYASQTGVDQ